MLARHVRIGFTVAAILLCCNARIASAACVAAPSGMTGWWPGDNATTDVLNGRNATLHNGTTYGTGKVGPAFQFDGSNDDASIADDAALDVGTGNFTVDFWVKPNVEGGEQVMVEKWDETTNTGWTLADRGGLYFAGSSGSSIQTSTQIVANTWTHIALRRSSGTVSVFHNGSLIQSTTANGNFDTTVPLLFGRRRGGQGFFWNGLVDEIHYFVGTALTNGEIMAIYTAGSDGVCPPIGCGNGITEGSEQCDDANAINGDGCDNNCTFSVCGNGIIAGSEECDDSNAVNGDGCDNDCTISCGNGVTTPPEECDDDNAVNGDGCDNNCTVSACGNGVTAGSEECDDSNAIDGDGCDNDCTISCGNGVITPPEECDDGNSLNGDGCENCTLTCGNGAVDPLEECDDGNSLNGDGCDTDCTISCGNGVTTPPEACDDGNPFDGDGCNSDCTVTAPCAPIPLDLTAWWPGDGGTADIQGGFNAVARNGAGYGIGRVRQAFNLDGANDFIDVPDDPGIDVGAGDFTVDLWVRFNDTAGEQVLIEKYVEVLDENSTGWSLTKLGNNSLRLATGTENADSHRLALPPETWIHFAARRGGGTLAVFVNGVLVADAPAAGDLSSPSSLKFGHRGSPFDTPGSLDTRGFFLNGRIDEVHLVVGRGLSDAEIQAIAASGPSGLCAAPGVCGNGVIEAGEPCDDGNGVDGDGCENDCTPSCGNGTTDPGEDCDDGNATEGDGCDSNCSVSACGNGVVGGSETCEDGNSVNGDGCDNNCSLTECGNGIVTEEESCDDGDLVDGDGCESDCTITPVEETAPPGGTVTTDPNDVGATPEAPIQVALTTPGGGMVSIASSNEPLSPSTVQALVQSLLIEAPMATAEAPLSIAIRIDASAIPAGLDLLHMTLTRDGVVLEDCIQPMIADPEPCIESRVLEGDGDVTITGLTAHASLWTAVAHGLFKAEQRCVNLTGKAGLNVAKAQAKLNAGCLKLVVQGASTDPQACVLTDSAGKVAGKKQRTIDIAAARCVPAPAFGFTTAAAINTAAQDAALGLLTELFGSNLNSAIVTDEDGAACQSKALKAAQKLFALNANLFLSCQKASLKGHPTPIVSLAELSACFDSLAINTKRLKTTSKLGKAIADKCGANVATWLPGNCGAAINPAYCLATRIGCRTCQVVNATTDLGRDCDLFDDFMTNGSCN